MTVAAERTEETWFGHPRGLTILFLTEMWDQFSFFGMRALLVYYMTKELLISQAHSSYIYGLYSSFVYFTPLIRVSSPISGSGAVGPSLSVDRSWRSAIS